MFNKTIRVSNIGQGTQFPTILINGIKPPETQIGETDVPFVTWLEIKRTHPKPIENKFWYVDQEEENRLFELYHSYCFQEFESLGIPSVKASITLNEFTQKDKLFFAHEWLGLKKDKFNLLNNPIGYVWLTAIGSVIGAMILYLIGITFNIHIIP